MSVIWASELRARPVTDDGSEVNTERIFRIKVSSAALDGEWVRQNVPGFSFAKRKSGSPLYLPTYLDSHNQNWFLTARKIQIEHEAGLFWKLKYEYNNKPLGQKQKEKRDQPHPLQRKVNITSQARMGKRVVTHDIHGDPVFTSAHETYDPPLEVDWETVTYHFRKNFAAPPDFLHDYSNSVNSATISIRGRSIPAGKAFFRNPTVSDEQYEGVNEETGEQIKYFTGEWDIDVDRLSFQPRVIDKGYKKLVEGKQVAITFKDLDPDNGSDDPITTEALLNGAGGVLVDPTLANAVARSHDAYYIVSFADMPGVGSNT